MGLLDPHGRHGSRDGEADLDVKGASAASIVAFLVAAILGAAGTPVWTLIVILGLAVFVFSKVIKPGGKDLISSFLGTLLFYALPLCALGCGLGLLGRFLVNFDGEILLD